MYALGVAKRVDRVAWTAYEEGKRNAYTAAAPSFTPRRLTSFMKDDGTGISTIRISGGGYGILTFPDLEHLGRTVARNDRLAHIRKATSFQPRRAGWKPKLGAGSW